MSKRKQVKALKHWSGEAPAVADGRRSSRRSEDRVEIEWVHHQEAFGVSAWLHSPKLT